nr:hypothetical protein [Tanacetum cinerariifolium]
MCYTIKKGGCIQIGGKIKSIDANEDINLVYVETQVDMDAELQERINQDVSTAEPIVFDDEEVTMTMAQTLIKIKAKKAKLLDEQIAKRLHDEEVKKTAARDKQEKDDLERAQVLQKQYDNKEENIDWNADNIRKYQSLKRKPVKYPIIDWEIHSEGSRTYWKIIRVSRIIEKYQSFEDMLKGFYREDLVALWSLVKEKFSSAVPNVDKEKALWVEHKRLFEPDANDVLWKLQRYMHYPITWKLCTNCGVHQVSSTTRRHDMFMFTEKDYLLSNKVMTLMLSAKLQVEEDSKMARDLVMKIFIKANKLKSRRINAAGSKLMLLGKVDTAAEVTEEITLNSKSLNKVSVIVILDLSKVANPLFSLRDKDLFNSNDPQVVVAAAKLPILNPNEFDLWKMRIKQYFLMTDYSLWEVILNGDSPTPTKIVDGAVQIIAPTTVEQRLVKKNNLNRSLTLNEYKGLATLDNSKPL